MAASRAEDNVVDLAVGKPFHDYAMQYHERGWHPLPLPPNEKSPPPKESTGHYPAPGAKLIEDWLKEHHERSNIGIRVPDGILGIDVDAYAGKVGGESLGNLTSAWGALPPTWTLSARSDGLSGIRFYQVPTGLQWPGEVGKDVQVIQFRHRYSVAWPSIHPKLHKMYRWYPPGAPIDGRSWVQEIPDITELT